MPRIAPAALLCFLIALSWMLMQLVHELGHIVGAAVSGGAVERVVWHPLTISRTDLEPNPAPLFVAWAGPLLGSLLPLAAWGLVAAKPIPLTAMLRFFAGFCLIANGAYLGFGAWLRVGDCDTLLTHGAPIVSLWLFGLVSIPLGLRLWHQLGPELGWGPQARRIPASQVLGVAVALFVAVTLSLLLGGEPPRGRRDVGQSSTTEATPPSPAPLSAVCRSPRMI